jgi:hypothetical protein
MTLLAKATGLVRSEGDPRVIRSGPSSRAGIDRLAQAIGWFSIGLGLSELLAAPRYSRALGVAGKEPLVRAFGARELASGMLTLSTERKAGLWSRVGGDVLDIGMLAAAMRSRRGRRGNLALALAVVVGVTALDLVTARGLTARHGAGGRSHRDYRGRSGFPQGVERAQGAGGAASLRVPGGERSPARVA